MKARRTLVAGLAAVACTLGLVAAAAPAADAASGPIFTVMNTSETPPDGVYFRNSPQTANTSRTYGLGVFRNEQVQLQCYAFGDAVGPYNNSLWYKVDNVTRPINNGQANVGFLNAHYINDGENANVVDAGVAGCGVAPAPAPSPPVPSITPTTGQKWAGYVATGTNITYVHGAWKVPAVNCGSRKGVSYAVFWVGIDGFANNELVQAGSRAICANGSAKPDYKLFWEQLPAKAMDAGAVQPGNTVVVDIRYHTGTRNYVIAISVNGILRMTRTGTDASAQLASAECIAEAPQVYGYRDIVPLANFGSVTFSSCSASTNGAASGPQLAAGSQANLKIYREDMARDGVMRAITSAAGSGGAPWTVTWRAP